MCKNDCVSDLYLNEDVVDVVVDGQVEHGQVELTLK